MGELISKAKAITDAKISFVSLVNKAANKRKFLITKAENGNAEFQSYGVILKSDTDTHYVTGVVYEPMTEDTDGNYMTEDEIVKAEKYFSEKQRNIDVQHSFEPCEGAVLVDSWITKCDCEIEGQPVKKGSWLMMVKVEDNDLWDKVITKLITGFSMGGTGHYSDEDVDLEKNESEDKPAGLFVRLAKAFGYDVIKKGEVAEKYAISRKNSGFWDAWSALCDTLKSYNSMTGKYEYASDSDTVKEALADFSEIIEGILVNDSVQKSVIETKPNEEDADENKPEKGGKVKSNTKTKANANANATKKPYEEEEKEMKKSEVETLINKAVSEAVEKSIGETGPEETPKTTENNDEITKEDISSIVKSAVSEELKKYSSIRGKSAQIDDEEADEVKKSEEPHYMHGIL